MKKVLALSSLGSSVAVWALTTLSPKLVGILLIGILATINQNPPFNGGANDVAFDISTSTVANNLLNFALSFFSAGGITNTELILGL